MRSRRTNHSLFRSLGYHPNSGRRTAAGLVLLFVLLAAGCDALPGPVSEPANLPAQAGPEGSGVGFATAVPVPPLPKTEVTFTVQVPENTPPDEIVYLSILDEVTGLAINAENYPMQEITPEGQAARVFSLNLPFSVGAVVKYRYERQTPVAAVAEHTSDGDPVRYRLYAVDGPGAVSDQVSRWTDTPFTAPRGRVQGQIVSAADGQPVADILVAAGGKQTRTASDGSFIVDGLPPGVHNLVAYATDASFTTYQQGAEVAPESMTPAPIALSPAPLVNVIFVAALPEGTPPAVPVRLAGNLYQVGNTFAALSGGTSVLANRMPVLSALPDGRYSLSIALPAGAYLRYKYTLGDGFWNAEHDSSGEFVLRELVVPAESRVIEDRVENWGGGDRGPVVFDLQTPAGTPAEDVVSIQLNPVFGWMEPLPMWRLGPDRWAYALYGPLNVPGLAYRYCRNEQCGSADDLLTAGPAHPGRQLALASGPQTVQDLIEGWIWAPAAATDLVPPQVQPRGGFVAGIELQPYYHPSFLQHTPQSFEDARSLGANAIFLSPTWAYSAAGLPLLEPHAGQDPPWLDVTRMIDEARLRGLGVGLFPQPRFSNPPAEWWQAAGRDFGWWQVWFEQYRIFALHHADLAARQQVPALILGGGWLSPALPAGQLADGSPSGVPADAEERWRALLAEVRSRYNGTLLWALSFEQIEQPPAFLDAVDWIYLTFSTPLAAQPGADSALLAAEAARLLDTYALPVHSLFDKPFILAADYPAATGAASGCIPDGAGGCLVAASLSRPQPDIPAAPLDLNEQANIYAALLSVANDREWISGFVARDFFPPVALADKSASVHGKPAGDLLALWFAGWQTQAQP